MYSSNKKTKNNFSLYFLIAVIVVAIGGLIAVDKFFSMENWLPKNYLKLNIQKIDINKLNLKIFDLEKYKNLKGYQILKPKINELKIGKKNPFEK